MSEQPTRRRFFRLAGAAPAVVATRVMAVEIPKPTGPITPEEYLEEMTAAGWRVYATMYLGRPQHVFWVCHEYRNTFAEFWRIRDRCDQSGPDFWERTSRYLFDRGLRYEVGPRTSGRSLP